ncbi:MAG: histidinol-phosphatase HisJ family protein [Oscillospiraceae bacterium]|nr:histidinol-phosphatase HisJ family protein [Oscillospiraceae bacterium]
MIADYHLHSAFSNDSETPMEDMIRRAAALGLDEICFTEHVDYGVEYLENCDYDAYFHALQIFREKYDKQIAIRGGIEFGVQLETIPQYNKTFQQYPFDFVIFSCHQIGGKEFCRCQYQEGKTQEEYQNGYYNYIHTVMQHYKNYSVLGHLDLIKRYDPCGEYPDEKILFIVEKILKQAIQDQKGIEVNTSALRYHLSGTSPSRKILELYHDLGGRILTIGSDAHDTACVADRIPEVQTMLKEIGFREICTFTHMQPVFHKL